MIVSVGRTTTRPRLSPVSWAMATANLPDCQSLERQVVLPVSIKSLSLFIYRGKATTVQYVDDAEKWSDVAHQRCLGPLQRKSQCGIGVAAAEALSCINTQDHRDRRPFT